MGESDQCLVLFSYLRMLCKFIQPPHYQTASQSLNGGHKCLTGRPDVASVHLPLAVHAVQHNNPCDAFAKRKKIFPLPHLVVEERKGIQVTIADIFAPAIPNWIFRDQGCMRQEPSPQAACHLLIIKREECTNNYGVITEPLWILAPSLYHTRNIYMP